MGEVPKLVLSAWFEGWMSVAMNPQLMLLVWKNWKIDPHLKKKTNKMVEISRLCIGNKKMGIK